MLQLIGLIVATYAVCRLLQVPAEAAQINASGRMLWLLLVSFGGIAVIGVLALKLLMSGTSTVPGLSLGS